jgi:hypothetical protein
MNDCVNKPTVPEVLPLVKELYSRSPVGCCLHIVLDDGNVRDSDVAFCQQWALDRNHDDCSRLASLLMQMSERQRTKLHRINLATDW